MSYCGVVEVRSLEDALGATCGRAGAARCSDCDVVLCLVHVGRCALCSQTFCPSCLSFHKTEHPKAPADERVERIADRRESDHRKKSA